VTLSVCVCLCCIRLSAKMRAWQLVRHEFMTGLPRPAGDPVCWRRACGLYHQASVLRGGLAFFLSVLISNVSCYIIGQIYLVEMQHTCLYNAALELFSCVSYWKGTALASVCAYQTQCPWCIATKSQHCQQPCTGIQWPFAGTGHLGSSPNANGLKSHTQTPIH
jgi:hypothetical protein